jgi:hypothetical protein
VQVSVGVDANHKEFIFYKGGIFDHQPCNDTEELLTHAITAVGYGQEDGVGFWIVRNQWNTNWGEEGYMRMAMGVGPVGSDVGICGTYADVASLSPPTLARSPAHADCACTLHQCGPTYGDGS